MWIGCADSRVPASEVTSTEAGRIFEHRNIANLCQHSDINLLSVLDYSVNSLRVKHIIVAGHYRCGGVHAALKGQPVGLIDHWQLNIRDIHEQHRDEIDSIKNENEQWDRLVELNVLHQVYNLSRAPIVCKAWDEGVDLVIHGWVIDLSSGLIKEMYQSDMNFRDGGEVGELGKG
ncbi:carbonic anhydrase [Pedobacter frigidisoli]|uniref:carbonic anhydrase n=1 Tax=Pedobacter frigidisoli TaxID=2530455 RepID=UPI002930C059|nr:carbonic anhydrase [Pedobacter frigidisoli]